MLVHKGGQRNIVQLITCGCRDVTPTKLQCQNCRYFTQKICQQRIEVIVKMPKKFFFFFFFFLGGGRCVCVCEPRNEVIVKMQNKIKWGGG